MDVVSRTGGTDTTCEKNKEFRGERLFYGRINVRIVQLLLEFVASVMNDLSCSVQEGRRELNRRVANISEHLLLGLAEGWRPRRIRPSAVRLDW